jgi:hypothetical protein
MATRIACCAPGEKSVGHRIFLNTMQQASAKQLPPAVQRRGGFRARVARRERQLHATQLVILADASDRSA